MSKVRHDSGLVWPIYSYGKGLFYTDSRAGSSSNRKLQEHRRTGYTPQQACKWTATAAKHLSSRATIAQQESPANLTLPQSQSSGLCRGNYVMCLPPDCQCALMIGTRACLLVWVWPVRLCACGFLVLLLPPCESV
jgi:hypothetical protein